MSFELTAKTESGARLVHWKVVTAISDVGHELGRGDDEALEQRRVAVELLEEPARRGERIRGGALVCGVRDEALP